MCLINEEKLESDQMKDLAAAGESEKMEEGKVVDKEESDKPETGELEATKAAERREDSEGEEEFEEKEMGAEPGRVEVAEADKAKATDLDFQHCKIVK